MHTFGVPNGDLARRASPRHRQPSVALRAKAKIPRPLRAVVNGAKTKSTNIPAKPVMLVARMARRQSASAGFSGACRQKALPIMADDGAAAGPAGHTFCFHRFRASRWWCHRCQAGTAGGQRGGHDATQYSLVRCADDLRCPRLWLGMCIHEPHRERARIGRGACQRRSRRRRCGRRLVSPGNGPQQCLVYKDR